MEGKEEFLTPITSAKRIALGDNVPNSPEAARSRLGNLLNDIQRANDISTPIKDQSSLTLLEENGVLVSKKGYGTEKERVVIIELRGKPFCLIDSNVPESIYPLCRQWVHGKKDKTATKPDQSLITEWIRNKSKNIHCSIKELPEPNLDVRVDLETSLIHASLPDIHCDENSDELLKNYVNRWKTVKRRWQEYSSQKTKRYESSLGLINNTYKESKRAEII